MHLFLTGFMGAGKSHDGRRLAAWLDVPFVDLDDRIEAAAGRTISTIFATEGEAYFRDLEARCLRELATVPPAVVATGGGAPCFRDNMAWMNEAGITVFLDPPVPVLAARLEAGRAHRPVLADAGELPAFIAQKLADRRPHYEKAQIHLRTTDESSDPIRSLYEQLVRERLFSQR